jgi:hypothetical protein
MNVRPQTSRRSGARVRHRSGMFVIGSFFTGQHVPRTAAYQCWTVGGPGSSSINSKQQARAVSAIAGTRALREAHVPM